MKQKATDPFDSDISCFIISSRQGLPCMNFACEIVERLESVSFALFDKLSELL